MPSLSGSAYHRRRSLRGRSNPVPPTFREQLKENDPYSSVAHGAVKTPAPPGPSYTLQTPSVLSSRNAAPSAVRELFTTPQTPAQWSSNAFPLAANTRLTAQQHGAWRPSSTPVHSVSPLTNIAPIDVHAGRVVYAVLGASGSGTLALYVVSYLFRFILNPSFSGGLFWFLSCSLFSAIILLLLILFIGMLENVFCAEHPRLSPFAVRRSVPYIFSKRTRILQLVSSGCCGAGLVFSVSFCMGCVYRKEPNSAFYPLWIGFFCGLAHSYFSQVSGTLTWRFSPTRETVIKRVRAELMSSSVIASIATFFGWTVSYLDLALSQRILNSTSKISTSMIFYVSNRIHFTTAISALTSMLVLSLVITVYMHMMTVAMNVRDHVSDASNSTLQSRERAVGTVHRLLADIAPENGNQDGLIALNRMLGIQFFRDVARTSRAGRRIIFEDSESILWNGILQGCVEPVKDLTHELTNITTNSPRNPPSATDFANGRSVAWACETLSHFLVASRDEDDFGIVQRQFVHVVMCLLALKNHVDAVRELRRSSLRDDTSWRMLPNLPLPQDVYFETDVVGAIVGDAVDLALVRIVDAFRAHLKGFLVGAEPHWDRRFDQSLQAVLDYSH